MLTVYADEALLTTWGSNDSKCLITSPSLSQEIGKSGSLKFSMYPTHPLYNSLKKLVTIVKVCDGDKILFRGRVYNQETKITTERQVYCEGDLSFLLDSLVLAGDYTETVAAFFTRCITAHNNAVEAAKQFEIGTISVSWAQESHDFKLSSDDNTKDVLDSELLSVYGGYIQTRHENGKNYVDYVEEFTEKAGQELAFGSNILDFTDTDSSDDVFSILRPTGKDGLTIESANYGSAYLADTAMLQTYGSIYKTVGFSEITDAAELLKESQKYMARELAHLSRSMVVKAVDLHLLNPSVDRLEIGKQYRVVCTPLGIDWTLTCTKVDGLFDPANTSYSLGVPEDSLSDQHASASRSTAQETKRQNAAISNNAKCIWETQQDLEFTKGTVKLNTQKLELNSKDIQLNAENIGIISEEIKLYAKHVDSLSEGLDNLGKRTNEVEIDLDAVHGELKLKATTDEVTELGDTVKNTSIELDSLKNEVALKAEKSFVDGFVDRLSSVELTLNGDDATAGLVAKVDNNSKNISSAQLTIDGMQSTINLKVDASGVISAINLSPEEVTISAKKINLNGYVTASQLDAVSASIENLQTGKTKARKITAASVIAAAINIAGFDAKWQYIEGADGSGHWFLVHS